MSMSRSSPCECGKHLLAEGFDEIPLPDTNPGTDGLNASSS
ncbi:MAG TPA: hypothetical protein VK943_03355 [Arenibaculum sp.]|nr:hypothetical protein [Arenibaculum sp.]